MGTDIYAYVEVQDDHGSWQLRGGNLCIPRSRALFALMAANPRDVPADMSKELAKEVGYYGHSASWLTQQEFADVVAQYDPERTGFLLEFLECMQYAKGRPTRLVFWFD